MRHPSTVGKPADIYVPTMSKPTFVYFRDIRALFLRFEVRARVCLLWRAIELDVVERKYVLVCA